MKSKILGVFLTLVVIFNCFALYSCEKNREYDEAVVKAAADELIKKSIGLNEIFYGKGLSYSDDESKALGPYSPATEEACSRYGIETIDDIKTKTRAVFSTELSNLMFDTKLSTVYDSDGIIRAYSRYYQKYTDADNPTPEYIMVYTDAVAQLKDTVTYDYSTLSVKGSKGETVYVEIEVLVLTDDGKSQTKTLEIGLIEEADGWRLSTPSYTSYVDLDYYNQLQNKNQK